MGDFSLAGQQTGGLATSSLAIAELIAFPLLALLSLVTPKWIVAVATPSGTTIWTVPE